MIRFVTPALEPLLAESADTFGIFGTKIYSIYQTYGAQSGIADFWLVYDGGTATGAAARLGNRLTVAARAATEELARFLTAVGGHSAEGELPLIEALNTTLGGRLSSSWIMRADAPIPPPRASDPAVTIAPARRLADVYALLCQSDASFGQAVPYDAWLAEASHKVRHGLAEIYTLSVENTAVCTLSIQFQSRTCAILAGLATDPAFRGRGFGRLLMAHGTNAVFARGLTPYLLTAEDGMGDFHAACGYQPALRWGCLC